MRTARFLVYSGVGLISYPSWLPDVIAFLIPSYEPVNFAHDSLAVHGWGFIFVGILGIVFEPRITGEKLEGTRRKLEGFSIKLLTAAVGQKIGPVLGSIVGAFGFLNLLDSLNIYYLDNRYQFLDDFAPVFDVFKIVARFFFDLFSIVIPFSIPILVQDYLVMGGIVAGMRLRSSLVIFDAIKEREIDEYKEKFWSLDLTVSNDSTISRWVAFFFVRLSFAVVLWPVKLEGATRRYLSGHLRDRGRGKKQSEIQAMQYETFFGTVVWVTILFVQISALNMARL